MRTTISIDDRLLAEAKARAARSGRTLAAVVDDALRAAFARRDPPNAPIAPDLPTSPGGRLLPGVDLDDSAALLELMEGPRP
ncbi:MAG TPA: type II toxin-antitoxin system VapB family antitoxin [Candidatus Limnocylindrales bacterium]